MGCYHTAFARGEPLHRRAWSFGVHATGAIARRVASRLPARVATRARSFANAPESGSTVATHILERALTLPEESCHGSMPRVLSIIGSLAPGGAERQLAAFLAESAQRKLAQHELVTLNACVGVHAHYLSRVENAGVSVRTLGVVANSTAFEHLRRDERLRFALRAVGSSLRPNVADLVGEFLASKPDVVHAWLDHANIAGGIAAILADVPRVVLSLRSVHPGNFPMLSRPWMLPWYQALARDQRVRFVANSAEGADSYAKWIGIHPDKIRVVLNGLDTESVYRPSREAIARTRASIAGNASVLITGVLRLSEEKQPLVFVEVAREILAQRDDVCFALAGDGPMSAEVTAAAAQLGPRFQILGRRQDIPELLAASDIALLTSRIEGTPNVLLEAQWLGVPVVAARVGGVGDAVHDGHTGLLADHAHAPALTAALRTLLGDADMRDRFRTAGPKFIEERFGLTRMVDETRRCYE